MRHNIPQTCENCKRKVHELVFEKGKRLCRPCRLKKVMVMPSIRVKKVKCFKCGKEGYADLKDEHIKCRKCKLEMEVVVE